MADPQYAGQIYRYPSEQEHPELKQLKILAAKCGRATHASSSKREQLQFDLLEYMEEFTDDQLVFYRDLLMLDPRWNGATGQGGYWAAATAAVNSTAASILRSRPARLQRARPRSMFQLI